MWNPRWLHGIGPDVRIAVRSLLHTPTVTAVAVLSLVLGIGANAAMFSLVNSLILRRLPVPAPERLAIISTTGATTWPSPEAQLSAAGGWGLEAGGWGLVTADCRLLTADCRLRQV